MKPRSTTIPLSRKKKRSPAFVLAASLLLSILMIACIETIVGARFHALPPTGWFWIAALSMHGICEYLSAPIGFCAFITALAWLPSHPPWKWFRVGLYALSSAAISFAMYQTLTIYEPFRGYPLFVGGFILAAIGLVAYGLFWEWTELGRIGRPWRTIVSILLLSMAVGLHVANYRLYFGLYPTFHLSVMQVELLLLWLGFSGLLTYFAQHRGFKVAGIAGLAIAVSLAGTGWLSRGTRDVKPQFVDATVLGQSRLAFFSYSETKKGQAIPDPAGEERFHRYSGLPDLPSKFALEDHNILLVCSEATRFDKTSLFEKKLNSTPHLLKRSKSALVFERAYSPSSGTLHSMAANLSMAYPSMIAMETWMRVWTGQLYAQEETVAESLSKVGYDTFWVGYNHWFPNHLRGFEQGFSKIELIPGNNDTLITDKALEVIEERGRSHKPFFGWIFLVSPHGGYKTHGYADLPNERDVDRYLHELRFVDDQLERIFLTLERTKQLRKTIVIYMSDHGEEFREHGGTRHKTTVYTESIHVPLVVWIPEISPSVSQRPTSTMYLFPWLFSHARSPGLQERFSDRAVHIFGPLLHETQGAILVELYGHDRMKSSLIYPDLKINYDFISDLIEIYRTPTDRLEKRNVYGTDPVLTQRAKHLIEAYKKTRSARTRHILKPKKKPTK